MRRLTLWICAAAALVLIPLTALWSRSICRPLEDLTEVMRRVRDGELNRRVVSREHDAEEVRLVAEQTNQMLASINDLIARNEIDIIVNTPNDKKGAKDDSVIRKAAIRSRIFYVTTMAAAKATIAGIRAERNPVKEPLRSLQEFHASIQ